MSLRSPTGAEPAVAVAAAPVDVSDAVAVVNDALTATPITDPVLLVPDEDAATTFS